jgi:hypothetical protein
MMKEDGKGADFASRLANAEGGVKKGLLDDSAFRFRLDDALLKVAGMSVNGGDVDDKKEQVSAIFIVIMLFRCIAFCLYSPLVASTFTSHHFFQSRSMRSGEAGDSPEVSKHNLEFILRYSKSWHSLSRKQRNRMVLVSTDCPKRIAWSRSMPPCR